MNQRTVRIDAIRVRARGVPVEKARGIADGLGEAIAGALAVREMTRPRRSEVRVLELALGPVVVGGRPGAAIVGEIAARVADAVAPRMKPQG